MTARDEREALLYENKREHARVTVDIDGAIAPEAADDFADMLMANLSLGGCFIKTQMPEPPGAMVMLRFALPGEPGGAVVRAVGRVCWVKAGLGEPNGMGIQFVRVEDGDLTELKRYVAGLLESDLEEAAGAAAA